MTYNIFVYRIQYDDKIKNKLPKMIADLRRAFFEVPFMKDYSDKTEKYEKLGWMVDFSPDSAVNMALRKTDLQNFAMFSEGNVFNNLFFKVLSSLKCISNHSLCISGGQTSQRKL